MNTETKPTFAELKPFRRLDCEIVDSSWNTFCWLPAGISKEWGKRLLKILRRADDQGLVKIEIKLRPSELLKLEAVAMRCGISTADILEQFAADLTASSRNGGSDERDMAEQYFRRTDLAWAMHAFECDRREKKPIDPAVQTRYEDAMELADTANAISQKGY